MNVSHLSRLLFVLGIGLLVLSGWLAWQDYWARQDAVILYYDDKVSAGLPIGKEIALEAKLINRKKAPARVLGLAPC